MCEMGAIPFPCIVVKTKANKLICMEEQTAKFDTNMKSFRSLISFYISFYSFGEISSDLENVT